MLLNKDENNINKDDECEFLLDDVFKNKIQSFLFKEKVSSTGNKVDYSIFNKLEKDDIDIDKNISSIKIQNTNENYIKQKINIPIFF